MTGFVRVLGNLGVLLAWVVWSAFLLAHDWVDEALAARAACVGGGFTGAVLWFVILSYGISRGHGDRKSTRLNSSHLGISSAVFCLKNKTPLPASAVLCISDSLIPSVYHTPATN